MVTDAAGRLRGLMLIKARGDSKQAKKAAAKRVRGEAVARPKPNDADKAHLPLEEGVKLADGSTLRVSVAATPSGSMTLECFEADFIDHLLNKCLGPDQGKGKLPVFLILDGHASRWTVAGLQRLRENNVHLLCTHNHLVTAK